ncbi:MAG: MFS transporter [Anaerolineales bacterium]|nr:MFS transporter [Anaerolineales bacterium]
MTLKTREMHHAVSAAGAFRFPNYRLWFAGQSVSLIGTWMQMVAQQWVVYEMTGSKFMLGAVAFANSFPNFFLMLPAGVIADRLPRRTILLYTQTASMLLAFLLALLLAFGVLEVRHVFVAAVLLGVVNSLDAPTRQSFTVEIIDDRRDLLHAIALNSTMFNLARVIGPAVAGFVLASWGSAWCFGLNGASYLAVIAGLLAMHIPSAPAPVTAGSPLRIREGIRYARRHPVILPLILMTAVSAMFPFAYATLLPAFAVEVFHRGETALGFLTAAVGVGALLGSLFMAAIAHATGRVKPFVLGGILFPLSLLGFALCGSYTASLVLLLAAGFGLVVQNTSINSLIQLQVPDEIRGRIMSIYLLAFFGALPVGALQAGWIAQTLGPQAGMAILAAVGLGLFLSILAAFHGLRRI